MRVVALVELCAEVGDVEERAQRVNGIEIIWNGFIRTRLEDDGNHLGLRGLEVLRRRVGGGRGSYIGRWRK